MLRVSMCILSIASRWNIQAAHRPFCFKPKHSTSVLDFINFRKPNCYQKCWHFQYRVHMLLGKLGSPLRVLCLFNKKILRMDLEESLSVIFPGFKRKSPGKVRCNLGRCPEGASREEDPFLLIWSWRSMGGSDKGDASMSSGASEQESPSH